MIHLKRSRHPIKPHSIRIYKEEDTKTGYVRVYIIPEGKFIKAYARQLSSSELISSDAIQNGSEYEFTIWKREISADMYVEFDNGFGTKIYQMGSPDLFEFFDSEITFRGNEVVPKEYVETRWAT